MRPTGSNLRSNPTPTHRHLLAPERLGFAFLLSLMVVTAPTRAGDDDRPDLVPPLDAPVSANPPRLVNPTRAAITSTPTPTPVAVPSTVPPSSPPPAPSTAVLALPGLAGPAPGLRRSPFASPDDATNWDRESSRSALDQHPGSELTLDGPVEMRSGSPSPTQGRASSPRSPASGLTAIEDPTIDDQSQPPLPGSTPRRTITPSAPARRSEPIAPPPRRGRFFGLFPGPVVVPPHSLNTRPSTAGAIASGRDVGLPLEDVKAKAAAEVALKKRIEKQARDAVGDRARTVEVRVEQKNAAVQVRGVKFYQKRAVRKALESLPALSGLRSTIEVLD